MFGYENVGFVLAVMTKLARMTFVRDVVQLKAMDGKGKWKYCSDEWKITSTQEETYANGVQCVSEKTTDDGGNGHAAKFDFEIVELPPIWDEVDHRNEIEFGLRGGFNLKFCRVLTYEAAAATKASNKAGMVTCDVDPPLMESSQLVDASELALEARFRLHHLGKNDVPSKIVVSPVAMPMRDAPLTCSTGQGGKGVDCPDGNEATAEAVQTTWSDASSEVAGDNLVVVLTSVANGQPCGVSTHSHDFFSRHGISEARSVFVCDETIMGGNVLLEGNFDSLAPSLVWEQILMLTLTCLGAGLGMALAPGKVAALYTGIPGFVYTVAIMAIGGVGGFYIGTIVHGQLAQSSSHLDGIMLRYLLKRTLQKFGQKVLYIIENRLEWEFPRP